MCDCDIVLYQAGADPHISDPYGGWLTTNELRERDAIVFDILAKHKVPVAWNLAGGYQVEEDGSIPKVLEIHDNTMRECQRVFLQ
jgi:acetoin utilization deacetylase AcuC-like enzyme